MIICCNNTLICKNLRYLRAKQRMSRLALARKTGVPRCIIKMLEEATDPPTVEFHWVEAFCRELEVTKEELLHTELEDVS